MSNRKFALTIITTAILYVNGIGLYMAAACHAWTGTFFFGLAVMVAGATLKGLLKD